MASIVTRTGKGSALTVPEMDQNFKNLDSQVLKTDLRPSSIPVFRNDILNSGVLDPRVTFSRNSTATYFDKFGIMRTASAGVPRIDYDPITGECRGLLVEEQRTNLVTYSEQFDNAVWTKTNVTITANAVTAPDATTTADKLIPSSSGSLRSIYYTMSVAGLSTFSVYAKAGEKSKIFLFPVGSNDPVAGVWFDLTAGTYSANGGVAGAIVNASNGWYRCSAVFTNAAYAEIGVADTMLYRDVIANGTDGIYIWGAQLEAGSTATSYIPTVATKVTRAADVVKIPQSFTNSKLTNISTVQLEAKSAGLATGQSYCSIKSNTTPINQKLIRQTQSKNLLTNSEKFDQSPWTVSAVTVASSTTVNPLTETLTVKKIVDTVASSIHYLYYNVTTGLTISKPYTYSVYAKASGRDYFALRWNGDTSQDATFNLTTGTIVAADSTVQASMRNIGNGWYRCAITVRPTTASSRIDLITSANSTLTAYAGDGSSGTLIWGAQLEAEEKFTKYVPEPAYAIQVNSIAPTQSFNDQTEITKFDRHAISTDGSNVYYASNGKYVGSQQLAITQINDIVIGADDTEVNQINGHIQKISVYNTTSSVSQLISLSS